MQAFVLILSIVPFVFAVADHRISCRENDRTLQTT
jgi:hypothetical protein